jgi:hypothetical protein
MDSHVVHSMLTTMLTNKTLLYGNLVRTAHHPVSNTGTDPEDPMNFPLTQTLKKKTMLPQRTMQQTRRLMNPSSIPLLMMVSFCMRRS